MPDSYFVQLLDNAIVVLKALDESNFSDSASSFLHPYAAKAEDPSPYFDLPLVLVPPEAIELENLSGGADESATVPKNEEWPEYRVHLFDNDVRLLTHSSRWTTHQSHLFSHV